MSNINTLRIIKKIKLISLVWLDPIGNKAAQESYKELYTLRAIRVVYLYRREPTEI